ncbi:HlyD family efflux transporter periplasmic adaptor subunit [Piscinibacter gummiphilus]|uniref:Hemolysin D n=1 Tax=Piscinibacter gummiphilus TaxID=946333 RepID=A0A1W6L6P7_9BURK|nr:HlyD family efflux transporter periplasmic adaptor subunit [Piscinibacter gummiphilus]ARN19924.1 hemolysin D [Piscinibacter gummiphilus]ATU64598.1 EmrA/EmrK family multidrug efflux transporter periplasmic adaptor subunit [Piscinibacter gummiphilus]GLS94984.1 multidrug resistance protein A [Piscinibacter gummiphilus]
MNAPQTQSPESNPQRKKALTAVAAVVAVAGIAYGAYYALVLNHFESTDNAYVQGNVVQLTPQVGGTVLAINADDTDFVKAGTPLVKLDTADARVALDQAEAQLAQTVREVRILFANNATLQAQIALREADQARAESDLLRAQDDLARRAPLVATGAVGKEEFNHTTSQLAAAKSAVAAAKSAVLAAREQLTSNQSLTDNTSVEQHPNVLRASARVREAYLALKRAELPSPVDGYVAKRSVQVGQRVQAGAPLMSVIALDQVWVDANFKESQLQNLRIGQPVSLKADLYGKKVEYHGKIEGLGAGTGAAFALLPAQNATGNWIKVVQRVPVRVSLDPRELADHPLRVGLSMDAKVDISDTSGKMLADAPRRAAVAQTTVFDEVDRMADDEVRRIVATNLGRGAKAPARAVAASEPAHKGAAAPVTAHVAIAK